MTILNNGLNSIVYSSLMILGWAFLVVYPHFVGMPLCPGDHLVLVLELC